MNTPNSPSPRPTSQDDLALESKLRAMQDLQREMATLHARLEYVRMMLKLGVGPG
ncbi:MAG: hypothetical protein ACKOF9_12685 [Burkholderiales bacterium]